MIAEANNSKSEAPDLERESQGANQLYGLLVEFGTPQELVEAARRVQEAGFRRWDAHSPFPVHGLDQAMGLRPTGLPWIALGGGAVGAAAALLLQWWTNAVNYPFLVSGKPLFSLPSTIPIVFELTILFSAFGAFFGMLALNGLPMLYHPVFRSRRFRRAAVDRFFIAIEAADPRFDPVQTRKFAESLGGLGVEELEE